MDHVSLKQKGPVWTITINRPDVRNAIGLQTLEELDRCFDQALAADCRALILTAAGTNFIAGGDWPSRSQRSRPWRSRR